MQKPEKTIILEFEDRRGQNCAYFDLESGGCIPLAIGCLKCQIHPVRKLNHVPDHDRHALGFMSSLFERQAYISVAMFSILDDEGSNRLKALYLTRQLRLKSAAAMTFIFHHRQQDDLVKALERGMIQPDTVDRMTALLWRLASGDEWSDNEILEFARFHGFIGYFDLFELCSVGNQCDG